jgi:hypothetical protein
VTKGGLWRARPSDGGCEEEEERGLRFLHNLYRQIRPADLGRDFDLLGLGGLGFGHEDLKHTVLEARLDG